MVIQSPFSLLEGLFNKLTANAQPPEWVVDELQQKLILLANHVLMQEPQACERLARQKGKVMRVQWRGIYLLVTATPAGLLDRLPAAANPDLSLTLTEPSPVALVQAVLQGDKPAVRIEGDIQLAAEVNWLVDNVRWEIEEDLARLLGDVPAHTLVGAVRQLVTALRRFVVLRPDEGAGKTLA